MSLNLRDFILQHWCEEQVGEIAASSSSSERKMDICEAATRLPWGNTSIGGRALSCLFWSTEGVEFETFRHLHIFPTIVFLLAVREGLHLHGGAEETTTELGTFDKSRNGYIRTRIILKNQK